MDSPKDILVIIDPGAEAHPALDKGARLAAAAGANLTLLCCDHDPALVARLMLSPGALSAARTGFLRKRGKMLDGLAEPLRTGGLAVETSAVWDSPLAAGILREVGVRRPGMVVKDTHWHTALRRGLFSNTDWELIRGCPVPLLLAKPSPWPDRPIVGAAVDPGHPGDPAATLDRRILAAAEHLAEWLGGVVHLLHAYADPDLQQPARLSLGTTPFDFRRAAQAAIDELLEGRSKAPDAVHLLPGPPLEVLPGQCAAAPVDVLVTGALARSRLYEVLIGGTAERLLDRVSSDLLVVRRPQAD